MTTHFLRSYSKLLIKTCHRRGAFAMGGMAAQIPIKNDPVANEAALAKVRADKEREAGDGHDGTWVAHPGSSPIAMEIFDRHMPTPNQLHRKLEDVQVTRRGPARDARRARSPKRACATTSTSSLQYLAAWLGGNGCVPIHNLMEDAATAEIARSQVWQWIRHPSGVLDDGGKVTVELFRQITQRGARALRSELGEAAFAAGNFARAAELLDGITVSPTVRDFPDPARVPGDRLTPRDFLEDAQNDQRGRAGTEQTMARRVPAGTGSRRDLLGRRRRAAARHRCRSSTRSRGSAPKSSGSSSTPSRT